MEQKKLDNLMRRLADKHYEPGSSLASRIKHSVKSRGTRHAADGFSIIVDLRINKLTAAAAIIIATVLLVGLFSDRDPSGTTLIDDGKVLMQYVMGTTDSRSTILQISQAQYQNLLKQGKDVTYYGDVVDLDDPNGVLLHWRQSDGSYAVLFTDLHQETVTADELVELQTSMLNR